MPRKIFFILFATMWILPAVVTYFNFDSFSLSTSLCALFFTLVYLIFKKTITLKNYFFKYFIFFLISISANIIITSNLFMKDYDINRSLISLFLFFIILLGAYFFSEVIPHIKKKHFDIFFKRFFYFYIIIIIISFFTKSIFNQFNKPIFPYQEPSHLALFLGPVFCYNVISTKNARNRILLILLGLIIALVIKNLTFLVTVIVVSIFIYNIYFVPIGVLGGLVFYYFSDIEYFLSRLDFANSKTTNLSTLVYIKGYELMQESLKQSSGLGIGFQQLGIVDIQTKTQKFLIKILGMDLNAKDGGFLSAKLISEFGILGILIVFYFLYQFIKEWLKFRKINLKSISATQAIFYSSFITFFSEFFIRSLGYLSPTVFLFLTAIFLYHQNQRKNRINNF